MVKAAKASLSRMAPEEQEAMWKAQRESWVRGMTTSCEHGELDFEQCVECRKEAKG